MSDETVLVTGGAGYIGSHAVLALLDAGVPAVVLDDLSTGRRSAVPEEVPFVTGNAGDAELVASVIARHRIGTIMHFAGSIVVPESVSQPLAYYRNNTVHSHALIETAVRCGVGRFVFSSTAAVYGVPGALPIGEGGPTAPINPYGASKLMTETMLRDAGRAYGLRYGILRYFNVAGADLRGRSGQCGTTATHLIKIAVQVATGQRSEMTIHGEDYDTPDGTCVRDYIHVSDLADAHVRLIGHLADGGDSVTLNCGYGRGCSVREVLAAVERAAGRPLAVRMGPRRPGDPPALVADASRIRGTLEWRPRFDDLDLIVRTALDWERRTLYSTDA